MMSADHARKLLRQVLPPHRVDLLTDDQALLAAAVLGHLGGDHRVRDAAMQALTAQRGGNGPQGSGR